MVVVLEECVIFSLWNKCHERKSQGCDHIQKGWWMQLWRNQSSELVILDIPEIRWNSLLLHSSGCSVIIEDDKFPYDNRSSHSLTLTKNGFLQHIDEQKKQVSDKRFSNWTHVLHTSQMTGNHNCMSVKWWNLWRQQDRSIPPGACMAKIQNSEEKGRWALQGLKICKIGKINGKAATQLIILHISV